MQQLMREKATTTSDRLTHAWNATGHLLTDWTITVLSAIALVLLVGVVLCDAAEEWLSHPHTGGKKEEERCQPTLQE